jgi:hypothetical protein
MECLAVEANVTLRDFCDKLSQGLNLPKFEYDAENENEWGWTQINNIEINVSHPYVAGKLQEWDESTPKNCNFGILLIISNNAPLSWDLDWSLKEFVPNYAQKIANIVNTNVYCHRAWVAPGRNKKRNIIYHPEVVE